MKRFTIDPITHANAGIAREWALCRHYMVERTAHDHTPYNKGSDLDLGDKHISIKASAFTLMAGSLCHGEETFDGIWAIYEADVHSNCFDYITLDFTVYEMTLDEFKQFVYAFGRLERESSQNGGQIKIKCRKESGKMLRWLEERAA